MSEIPANISTLKDKKFLGNLRTDNWWAQPMLIIFGLTVFLVYGTWAAFQASYYTYGPYISPFYSPLFFVKSGVAGGAPVSHAIFGEWPAWLTFIPPSPSFFILIFPFAFRFTCYFFRRTYYRGFTGTPPACAVNALPRENYKGETGILTFQNLHRYALYFIIIVVIIHFYDLIMSFSYHGDIGIGVGTVVLALDTFLLAGYVFGCHSFRHLVGGSQDCFSCNKGRYGIWKKVTWLNDYHGFFGWASLIWIMVTDLYIRLTSMGVITDFNTWKGI